MKRPLTNAEILLPKHLAELGITVVAEYKFHEGRKWRFDFASPELMLGIEIEGGIWTGGRHVTGQGYQNDLWKYQAAFADGWHVVRFSTQDVLDGKAKECIKKWFDDGAEWLEGLDIARVAAHRGQERE